MAGELALNGELRPVRGLLAIALEARAERPQAPAGAQRAALEASVVSGIDIIGITHLREAVDYLAGNIEVQPEPCRAAEFFAAASSYSVERCRRERPEPMRSAPSKSAVSGGQNRSGSGAIADRQIHAVPNALATIMPGMSEEEAIETTKIHSAGGLISERLAFIATRPFRAPHRDDQRCQDRPARGTTLGPARSA